MAGLVQRVKLYGFQREVLEATEHHNKVAYYLDMGLGKTFVGSEKAVVLGADILAVCQLSKLDDWCQHFKLHYGIEVYNLTKKKELAGFLESTNRKVGVINYDLVYRRQELLAINSTIYTLLLDESSLIQNENTKRSRFILNKLLPENVILLSGTPTGGKYERLWSQMKLLGWRISKELYWRQYVEVEYIDVQGFPIKTVTGYKNVDRLKNKMREYGCIFLKTDSVFELPAQLWNEIMIEPSRCYKEFCRHNLVAVNGKELIGDNLLVKLLYQRQLCGAYSREKLEAFRDLLESTDDKIVVFYNFNEELEKLVEICRECERKVFQLNGTIKQTEEFNREDNCVMLAQYQAGAMGVNLQSANKVIYFTPTLSSELYEQSKKRIHRIGQNRTCYYYKLVCRNSIESKIYKVLDQRRDYTEELFKNDFCVN